MIDLINHFKSLNLLEDDELNELLDEFNVILDKLEHSHNKEELDKLVTNKLHTIILENENFRDLGNYFIGCKSMSESDYVEGIKFIFRSVINEFNNNYTETNNKEV